MCQHCSWYSWDSTFKRCKVLALIGPLPYYRKSALTYIYIYGKGEIDRGHTGKQSREEVAGYRWECLRKDLRGKGHSPWKGKELQGGGTSKTRTQGPECASKSEGTTRGPMC